MTSTLGFSAISYMGANLVAQQIGYRMQISDWMRGDDAANDYYRPIETFPARFEALAQLVVDAGFTAVDIWVAQLNWAWATAEHVTAARAVLDRHGLTVPSYAGNYGANPAEFEQACQVAQGLGARILGGNTELLQSDRATLVALLTKYDLVFGYENHGPGTPEQFLDTIGPDADGRIGTAVDTGWWATFGVDAAHAIRVLGPRILHVHLKDIKAVGGHQTCALGEGIVPIRECITALAELGYTGPVAIEHEREDGDPTPDVIESYRRLRAWTAN